MVSFTWTRVKGNDHSAITEHLLFCNDSPDLKLCPFNQHQQLTSIESLLIKTDHPPLKNNKKTMSPSQLF